MARTGFKKNGVNDALVLMNRPENEFGFSHSVDKPKGLYTPNPTDSRELTR